MPRPPLGPPRAEPEPKSQDPKALRCRLGLFPFFGQRVIRKRELIRRNINQHMLEIKHQA